ncbi:phage integrase central domain-containing protein [Marinobacter sp. EVN1]|uniref:phage integrase central domain-containing protein n=1 Tax=Marinobacter sp. EVN1 TaxID=1397532 RepID=UPI0039B452DE
MKRPCRAPVCYTRRKTLQACPQNSSVNETGSQNGITSTWQHPITGIEPPLVLRKIQAQGKYETAHRIKQRISQVSRFAISDGWAERILQPTFAAC